MEKMSRYLLGEYALVIDILGTVETMAENIEWLDATERLLETIERVAFDSLEPLMPEQSIPMFQHGDTVYLIHKALFVNIVANFCLLP